MLPLLRHKCQNYWLIFFFTLTITTSPSISCATQTGHQWKTIPITTEAQKKAHIAGGEGFQQVLSIVYSPSNPQTVYIGSDTTQVWKSIDGGFSWRVAGNGIDSNGVCSLLVHPENENFVLAAGCLGPEVKRAHQSLNRKEGIFRTLDGGGNWTFVYKTEFHKQQSMGSLFAIDPRTVNDKSFTIYSASYNEGLLISDDSGLNWKKTNFNIGSISDIESSFTTLGALIISTTEGLFWYKDKIIKKIGTGLDGVPTNIALSAKQPKRVVAAIAGHGIYISHNNGISFQKSSSGLPPVFISKIVDVFASPANSDILYASTWKSRIKGPYYSNNGGKSWTKSKSINSKKLTSGKGFWFPSPITPHPTKPNIALAASNGATRILRTKNSGKTWFYSGSGYTGGRVIDMAFKSPQEWYLALTDHGLWRTDNNGETFTNINIPHIHPKSVGAIAINGKNIFLSIGSWKNKKLTISHDDGKSWRSINKVTGGLKFIRLHPQNSNIIYASNYRSDDNGKTWVKLKHKVRALFQSNGDIVYGFDKQTSYLVESTDRGNTWNNMAHCNHIYGEINEMASDPKMQGRLYLASNSGIFHTNRKTCEKSNIASGFIKDSHGSVAIKSIAINPIKHNIIYAGRWAPGIGVSSGIFISEDYGQTWQPFNKNIPGSFNVWSIDSEPDNATIYISTTYGLQVLEQTKK